MVLLLLIVYWFVIVEFYIGIVIVELYIGIVIVKFYIGIVIVEFLNHYYFFIAYSNDVSYYMCLVVLVAIVNAINILTHGFGCNIDLFFSFFLFSELFGTRAYALVQITQKIKKINKINPILHPNPCVNVYLIYS